MNKVLNAALDYSARGLSIIPVKPYVDENNKKKPFIKWREFQHRTATEDEIRSWWDKWPDAMIGIITGEISGLFVIDCDSQAGFEAIQELLPDRIEIPMARTPRGGWHLYFQYPAGSGLTVQAGIMPGVDIRGKGGYVIAAPSSNAEGSHYRWVDGLSLAEVVPAPVPGVLKSALINNINISLYRGDVTFEVTDLKRPQLIFPQKNGHIS